MSSEALNTPELGQAKDLKNEIFHNFTFNCLQIRNLCSAFWYRSYCSKRNYGIEPKELGMFNMFSGGAVTRMAIFALGIMPYISSAIIVQLLQAFQIILKFKRTRRNR